MTFILTHVRTGEEISFPFTAILELLGDNINNCININEETYRISSCKSGTEDHNPILPKHRAIYTSTADTIFYAPLSGEAFEKSGNVDYVDTPYGKMVSTHGELNSYVKLSVKYTSYDIKYLSFVFRYHASAADQGFFVDTPNDTKYLYYKGFYVRTITTENDLSFEQTGSARHCPLSLNTLEEGKIYLLQYSYNKTDQYSVYLNGVKIQTPSGVTFYPSGTDHSVNPKFGSTANLSNFYSAPCKSELCELLVEKRAWTDEEIVQYAKTLGFENGKLL